MTPSHYQGLPGFCPTSACLPACISCLPPHRTLTHELGHYFGLAHPFGSCAPDADGIADTPAELDAASGCPVKRNTCPVQSGLDPVWSFMVSGVPAPSSSAHASEEQAVAQPSLPQTS